RHTVHPSLFRIAALARPAPPMLPPFFFPDPAPPEIYTLSLHDALPISILSAGRAGLRMVAAGYPGPRPEHRATPGSFERATSARSEEHTSELQSRENLVCRLLLEKKNNGGKTSLPAVLPHDAIRSHAAT